MKHCSYLLLLSAIVLSTSIVFGKPTDYAYDDENVEEDGASSDFISDQPQTTRRQQRQHRRQEQPVRRHQSPPEDYEDYEEYSEREAPAVEALPRGRTRMSKVGGETIRRVYDEETNPVGGPTAVAPAHDPLAHAMQSMDDECDRKSAEMIARFRIIDHILRTLGPDFMETLPKPPNNTFATVPTPINITAEPCPYKYKRCSSETFFPSCDIPQHTDPETWAQRFNLYFDLSNDFETLDILNATLRLYKNKPIPLRSPKQLLIKAHEYGRSGASRRRPKKTLVAEKAISSDYIGWVSLNIAKTMKRWRRARNNHGLQISVVDADTIPWDASNIFIIMNCSSGNNSLVPLPFEVQTDEIGQRYPALNVRQGSLDDEFPTDQAEGVTEYIQADDPDVSDDDYDMPQSPVHTRSNHPEGYSDTKQNNYPHNPEHSAHHRRGHSHTGHHRANPPANEDYPYGTGSAERDMSASGHPHRNGHEHVVKSAVSFEGASSNGSPHHESPTGDYLITNQATKLQYGSHHTMGFGHSQQGSGRHTESRYQADQSSMEDNIQIPDSEEQLPSEELRDFVVTTESSRSHRRGSGNTKEKRHHKKNHHRQSRREERNGSSATAL